MVRHKNHASGPEICRPKMSATAEWRPSAPILPRPLKSKARRLPPRTLATRFEASNCAWRVACWAVGGAVVPEMVGTCAQSPSAQTPSTPWTWSSGVTRMRPPLFLGSASPSISGCGKEGTVDTSVRVGILVPSPSTASTPVAAESRVLRRSSTPRSRRMLGETPQLPGYLGEDPVLRVHQRDADFLRVDLRVVASNLAHEVVQL